jgi:receptor expression-enhancing protein 5/6
MGIALPLLTPRSGAQIIFRSFLAPTLGRYFTHGASASSLRAKAGEFNKAE